MNINGYFEGAGPKISVLMPISKLDEFFELALDSILVQSFKNFELIILANGCSDVEFLRLSKIATLDARIILKKLNVCGLMFALNYGIEISRAEIIARMDCDDVSMENRFQLQYDYLIDNKDIDVVGGRIELIDVDGVKINKLFKYYETHEQIIKVLPFRNPLCHPGLMFRKTALIKVWGYRFGFMSEDHEMFIRMMCAGIKFHNLNSCVLQYRRHPNQITNNDKSFDKFIEISVFLLMYLYKTKNLKYLIGMIAIYPPVRRVRNFFTEKKWAR